MRYVLLLIVAIIMLTQSGCVMVKIGGVKSVEKKELSRKLQDVRALAFSAIEPRLTDSGELTLWMTGKFEEKYVVNQRVTEYGDEWMAIGFFPGWDSLTNGYIAKDGKEHMWHGMVLPIVANAMLVGLPTIGAVLELCDTTVAKKQSGEIFAGLGFVGTYKYEGAKYLKGVRVETIGLASNVNEPNMLKSYNVIVDGVEMQDQDGIVTIGREVQKGEVIRFKIVSCPIYPSCLPEMLEPFLNREFMAVCE